MRILGKVSFCVAVGMLVMAPHATAAVGVNLDVLWNPSPDDSRQVALHVTNMAYPMQREAVIEVFHRIPNQYDDYPVLAFICHHSHVDPVTVWEYKTKGHKWSNVMAHFGVSPGLLFVDLPRAPGPPYGNAYGYWRKNGKGISQDHISNDDVRFWVSLRAVSAYAAVQPARVMEWRDSGKQFNQVAQAKYREKHGKGPKMQEAGFGGPGNSPGNSKGKGKAKGHDKEHPNN